ncbi:MAG: hypothetical protein IT267_08580 [Saprospiraceae bacterium]|nr:hypothetical protein [Saprospiraceae bacterium]
MIYVNRNLLKLITGNFASAITLWPFVLLRSRSLIENKTLINHERIHLRQQIELFILFFYIWYISEYIFYRLKGCSKNHAYTKISFEQEAFANEKNMNYLSSRAWYAQIKYLKKSKN